jgi:hypothetical protein
LGEEEMMDRLLLSMGIFSIVLIAVVLGSLRRAHIRVEYSVSWLLLGVALLALSRAPGLIESMAVHLGLAYPPMALLLVVSAAFLLLFFRFSLILSRLKDNNIALAQRLAILEYHIHGRKQ